MLVRHRGLYANTPETDLFLDRGKSSYLGGWFEMVNSRLYRFWGSLTEGLRTGLPQNKVKEGGSFRLKEFLNSMTGLSMGAGQAIAEKFPWRDYQTFIDIGSAQGGWSWKWLEPIHTLREAASTYPLPARCLRSM